MASGKKEGRKVVHVHEEKRGLRIAFLASGNPKDKRAQSGSIYYMAQALEKHCEHVQYWEPITSIEKELGRIVDGISRRVLKKRIAYDHLLPVAKKHGKRAAQRLDGRSFDAIVAAMNVVDIALLETDIPIALVLDATFALQRDYYPQFTNLWQWSANQANNVEQMAYRNAAALLYSSSWAARSAVEAYSVDPERVHTIFFGANLDTVPPKETVLAKKPSERCRLLFMGVGWQRKGGAIAFETRQKLEEMGINAELIICGSTPPRQLSHKRMVVIPFLNKNDDRQSKELENLYLTSDFLLLPTRAECTPIVFNEANAFGVPVITTNTGGVLDVIRNGENGYVLPYSTGGAEYARLIAEIYRDEQRYTALVASSRAAYESRVNWDVWGSAVEQVLQHIVATTHHPGRNAT
jgi:glycosyltransferase involved in cell wall biosynthesis